MHDRRITCVPCYVPQRGVRPKLCPSHAGPLTQPAFPQRTASSPWMLPASSLLTLSSLVAPSAALMAMCSLAALLIVMLLFMKGAIP